MKIRVSIPATYRMCSYSTIATNSPSETHLENALWHYNSARAHDGLPPVKNLPKGTTFKEIHE